MGKKLVIKGVDYSANAITSDRVVTPSFTVGQAVRSANGELTPNDRQKYCDVELATTEQQVMNRMVSHSSMAIHLSSV